MQRLIISFLMLLNLLLLSACSEQTTPTPKPVSETPTPDSKAQTQTQKTALLEHFQEDSVLTWQATLDAVNELKKQVVAFLQSPSQQALEATLLSWEQSHTQYLSAQFYRQLGLAPLHTLLESDQAQLHSFDVRIDQQPLILGYLDSVVGYPQSGLIYSETTINEQTLIEEHQLGDSAYVALGFHALRSLIEGDEGLKLTPEERFAESAVKKDSYVARRRTLLSVLNQVLASDLTLIANAWLTPEGLFSQEITSMSEDELLTRIRQAIKLEQAALIKQTQDPDPHMNADAIVLREDRITRFAPLL